MIGLVSVLRVQFEFLELISRNEGQGSASTINVQQALGTERGGSANPALPSEEGVQNALTLLSTKPEPFSS